MLARELSDCQTGEHPGQLCGDLGWIATWRHRGDTKRKARNAWENGSDLVVTGS